MWVENHEDYVAADKKMKHNTALTGNAEYHEMLRSLYTKLRMRLLLTWHKLKITTAIFLQMVNNELVSTPVWSKT